MSLRVLASTSGLAFLVLPLGCVTITFVEDPCEQQLRDTSTRKAFIEQMPKGADLHSHIQGAVYAEDLIAHINTPSYFYDRETQTASLDQTPHSQPVADFNSNSVFREEVLKAWSIYGYAGFDGHGHFFAAFDKFKALTGTFRDESIVDVLRRAMAQNVLYLELMVNPMSDKLRKLIGDTEKQWIHVDAKDFDTLQQYLKTSGFLTQVEALATQIDNTEHSITTSLGFDPLQINETNAINLRFLFQVPRTRSQASVFSLLFLAFHLAHVDHRFVGLNLVGPEDNLIALRDYSLHMQMVRFFSSLYPDVGVTLHAGEVTSNLAPVNQTQHHVRDAIEIAQAKRIGHGTNIMQDPHWKQLLELMAQRSILLEACLSSNDFILGTKGSEHPLQDYLEHGVPIAFATDDEGILRTSMSNEYLKAAQEHGFSYGELKRASRNSIAHSFLDADTKALLQSRLQRDFQAFETKACVVK